jgi:hypothetical protein
MFDGDFNVLGPERSEIDAFERYRLFRCLRNPSFMVHRISLVET